MPFREAAELGACVVCGAQVREPIWPNAWEASARTRALCGAACRAKYDPDLHWLPSRAPGVASDAEAARLLAAAKDRMRSGTNARPVARELLAAGVPPWMVRNAVVAAGARARASERMHGAMAVLTLGRLFASAPDERHQAGAGGDALADVEAWCARFTPA